MIFFVCVCGARISIGGSKMQQIQKEGVEEMYIAVVCKGPGETSSGRSNKSWASFLGRTRAKAVSRALEANERWGGHYTVLVGELKHVARPRRDYTLLRLQ